MGAPYALSSDLVSAWPAKSLEVAQYIDGQLPLIAMTQNAQTGTTYTLAATDFTKLVTLSNASPVTVTVPLESSVAWVAGTQLRLMNLGAGVVTVVGAGGVTINGSPLTLAQYKEGTLTKTGTNTWTFTGSASAPGMELVTPTSVAGATLSGGQVSFSASTEVDVNGCFTSAYSHYKIVFDWTPSAAENVTMRMRVGGANNTTSNYTYQTISASSTSVSSGRSASASSWLACFNSAGANAQMAEIIMYSPFDTAKTGGSFVQVRDATSGLIYYAVSLAFDATTSFDGFALIPTGGSNITGKLRVYGLRNS